jgi:hypothetical protein
MAWERPEHCGRALVICSIASLEQAAATDAVLYRCATLADCGKGRVVCTTCPMATLSWPVARPGLSMAVAAAAGTVAAGTLNGMM